MSKNPAEKSVQCQYGPNPVNCATGDFWHTFTDASVSGRGLPLDLQRTYNSATASVEGPFGYGWSSSYAMSASVDGSGNVTIHQENGDTVVFSPNGSGGFTAPPRVVATLVENGDGSYTFTRQADEIFNFSSAGQLESEQDLSGDTTTLSYTSGELTSVSDPVARTLTFAYGSNGLVSTVTDPLGRVTTYSYDSAGNLASVTDPAGRVTSFTYDTNHLLLTMTPPNGQSGGPDAGDAVTNTYDSSGRVTSQSDQAGLTTSFDYTSVPGSTEITDPNGNVTLETYTNGELISITKGYGTSLAATTSYSYDPDSLGITQVVDPDGHTTTNTYDASGNALTATDGDGNTTTYAYNAFNEQTCNAQPLAADPCSSLSPPAAITAGTATITPPSSAPPKYVTYTEYDTDGNEIYQTTGDYAPGSGTASQSRTTYRPLQRRVGHARLGRRLVHEHGSFERAALRHHRRRRCCHPARLRLRRRPDLVVDARRQLGWRGWPRPPTPTTPTASRPPPWRPDGNLSGANAGNYTTTKIYNADGEMTWSRSAAARAQPSCPG